MASNSVDVPLPIDFHLHLFVDKGKKIKDCAVVVALADAAIHRRQAGQLKKKDVWNRERECASEKGRKREGETVQHENVNVGKK